MHTYAFTGHKESFRKRITPYDEAVAPAILSPMGLSGLEPPTSRLSGVRSNQLSYKPTLYVLAVSVFLIISTLEMLRISRGTDLKKSGNHLTSHAVSSIVLSAVPGLTVVFGMGTGISPERIITRKF